MRRIILRMRRPGNHKPGATVNHFGGSLGGPILHNKLFFFFDSEWVRIALPIVTPTIVPSAAFQQYVLQQLPLGLKDAARECCLSGGAAGGAVLSEDVLALRRTAGGYSLLPILAVARIAARLR